MDGCKRRKQYELQDANNEGDKISNLPDCVLCHILSFLSTKDAIATCILSKRWKFIWACIPTVDFDDSSLYANETNDDYHLRVISFLNFVERVLFQHNYSVIEKFRLSCRICFDGSRVYEWVSTAIKQKVQEIDLFLFVEIPFSLPHCVFNSELLTILKIQMNYVLALPSVISLPHLITLHLALVTFSDDMSTQELFSSCPVLEELALLDCEWINTNHISISKSTLKNLTIDDLPYFGSNSESSGCEIFIDTANLRFFKYSGYLLNKIFISNLSSSVSASVDIAIPHKSKRDVAFRSRVLFEGLQNVKSLHVSTETIESLLLTDAGLCCIPVYRNLTYLELCTAMKEQTSWDLVDLLQHLPKVESLDFAEGFPQGVCFCNGSWRSEPVPKCFSDSLKSSSFHNFLGDCKDLSWLKYLLKNASVLEKLNVFFSKNPSLPSKEQKKIIAKVEKWSRASPGCLITFD